MGDRGFGISSCCNPFSWILAAIPHWQANQPMYLAMNIPVCTNLTNGNRGLWGRSCCNLYSRILTASPSATPIPLLQANQPEPLAMNKPFCAVHKSDQGETEGFGVCSFLGFLLLQHPHQLSNEHSILSYAQIWLMGNGGFGVGPPVVTCILGFLLLPHRHPISSLANESTRVPSCEHSILYCAQIWPLEIRGLGAPLEPVF